MKRFIFILSLILCGCASKQENLSVIKDLDGWDRRGYPEYPLVKVEFDAKGNIIASKEVIDSFRIYLARRKAFREWKKENPDKPYDKAAVMKKRLAILAEYNVGKPVDLEHIRWKIHPEAPLIQVAKFTNTMDGWEKMEFLTSKGIFIVGGINAGGRRIPSTGKPDIEYRIRNNRIWKNGESWKQADSPKSAIDRIFADLKNESNLWFVNIYFDFKASTQWSEAEAIISNVLPRIDRMRGIWLGKDIDNRIILKDIGDAKEGTVTLMFHDIWKNGWR